MVTLRLSESLLIIMSADEQEAWNRHHLVYY